MRIDGKIVTPKCNERAQDNVPDAVRDAEKRLRVMFPAIYPRLARFRDTGGEGWYEKALLVARDYPESHELIRQFVNVDDVGKEHGKITKWRQGTRSEVYLTSVSFATSKADKYSIKAAAAWNV